MSIADELREVARTHTTPELYTVVEADTLLDIANRIDEEHEKAMSEQFKSLTIDMEPMTKENMAKSGWVMLPFDANGVPIHLGDRLDGNNRTVTVKKIVFGKGVCEFWDDEGIVWYNTREFTHHKDTVEDVLRDVVTLCYDTWKRNSIFDYYNVEDMMKSGNISDFVEKLQEMVNDA